MTTYTYKNPSFAVIEIDEEYMIPVNIKTYFLNITKANMEGKATWELMIDYKVDFEMEDLSPDSFYKIAENVRNNEAAAIQYAWNKKKRTP